MADYLKWSWHRKERERGSQERERESGKERQEKRKRDIIVRIREKLSREDEGKKRQTGNRGRAGIDWNPSPSM